MPSVFSSQKLMVDMVLAAVSTQPATNVGSGNHRKTLRKPLPTGQQLPFWAFEDTLLVPGTARQLYPLVCRHLRAWSRKADQDTTTWWLFNPENPLWREARACRVDLLRKITAENLSGIGGYLSVGFQ